MNEFDLPNSILIDCTASEEIASRYLDVLSASISIATPNKRANAGPYTRYCELKETAARSNVKFFYETNVGAGLPILGTLNDLLSSGDKIISIEGVLSGTLSYIFNSFDGSASFSSVVRMAKEYGYTEPDPRDDLSGADVARKLLILAREMHLPLEESDITVEDLVSPGCKAATTVEEFFSLLKAEDELFASRLKRAKDSGKALRYIARIEGGKAEVSLSAVGPEHPCFALSGSDNVLSFKTERYLECPLVVKGPGAGTAVTAAGILADVVRIASYCN